MTHETVVITRPREETDRFAEALQALNYRVIHEPLMDIFLRHTERQALHQRLMEEPDAIIVTSRYAARALAALTELRDPYLLCVGEATAEAAESLGFLRVTAAGGSVQALMKYIKASYDEDARFLYTSGQQVSADIGPLLGECGMQVERCVLYDAVAAEGLSDTLVEQLRRGQINAITFLSSRTAQIFCSLINKAGVKEACEPIHAFALSEAVVDPLRPMPWKNLHIAPEATLASLVNCMDNAFRR